MIANNLSVSCPNTQVTTNSSSSALQAVHYSRQLIEKGEGSPEEHTLRRLCQKQAGTPSDYNTHPEEHATFPRVLSPVPNSC